MKRAIGFILGLFSLCISTYCQVPTKRILLSDDVSRGVFNIDFTPKTYSLGTAMVEDYIAEDEKNKHLGLPYRFGKLIEVDLNMSDGIWKTIVNGRIWKIHIESINTQSLSV